MNLDFYPEDEAFRQEVLAWIQARRRARWIAQCLKN